MHEILEILKVLRTLSGNAQLEYLESNKSDILREILEYTYNPHKKYKIEEGKFDKQLITIDDSNHKSMTLTNWNFFKNHHLDVLAEKKSATDVDVKNIKTFMSEFSNEYYDLMKMVLFKDLRLNMGLKKFQKVWPGFCQQAQVQLANKWEGCL